MVGSARFSAAPAAFASFAHLGDGRDAGVVALLDGAGAEGNTTARTDGGLFLRLARAYERAPLRLP